MPPSRRLLLATLLTLVPALARPAGSFDFSADAASQVPAYVGTQAEGKLKGIKRVAIANMCVQFVSAKTASGVSRGATRTYTRSASGAIPGGLDEARMQAVADQWLEHIEADFKSAGLEIVPYEELGANPLFQKFAARYESGIREGERSEHNNSKGDTSETVVYVSPKGRPFAPDCGTVSPASTSTLVRMSYPLNAEILTISAVIDMGQAQASGGLLRGARADIRFSQFLREEDSQFQFVGKMGPGTRLWLKQPIVPASNPFAMGASTSTGLKGERDDLSGTTTLSTGSSTQVGFDADAYYRNAADSLQAMHRMFLARMLGATAGKS